MTRKTIISLKIFTSIVVVLGVSFWLMVFHLKAVPFLDVSTFQETATTFDSATNSADGKVHCKAVTEIPINESLNSIKSYYYWDFDFEEAIMLFALKMHRCQIDQPGVNTWDGYVGVPDSKEIRHPVATAYYKIAYAIMESGGGALEYPVAAYSMRWAEINIKRIRHSEVLGEISKICKILKLKFKDSDELDFCQKHFPNAS